VVVGLKQHGSYVCMCSLVWRDLLLFLFFLLSVLCGCWLLVLVCLQVLLGGGSAGALASYFHAEHIASEWIPSSVTRLKVR